MPNDTPNDNTKTKNDKSDVGDTNISINRPKDLGCFSEGCFSENCFSDINVDDGNNINNVNPTIGRGLFATGPFIPEVDCGYNLTTNGISINFLKDPFCFRNGFLFDKDPFSFKKNTTTNNNNNNIFSNKQNFYMIKDNVKVLKPLVQTKIVKVPKYIYKENIIHQTETITKNLCVPHDAPIYVTREVKVPVYKEEIKYVPTIIEKERVYEIPKLEINELIQENLLFFHKNKIQYKKHNHVVERVIPKLKKSIIEKTIHIPSIQIPSIRNQDISDITSPNTPTNLSTSKKLSYDTSNVSEDMSSISNISNQNYLEKLNTSTDNPSLYKTKKQGMTQWGDSEISESINGQLVKNMSTLAGEHAEKSKMNEDTEKEKEKECEEKECEEKECEENVI